MKLWYQSKIVWLGILQTLIGALELIASYFKAGAFSPADVTILVSGILVVILRVWFTSEPVGGGFIA